MRIASGIHRGLLGKVQPDPIRHHHPKIFHYCNNSDLTCTFASTYCIVSKSLSLPPTLSPLVELPQVVVKTIPSSHPSGISKGADEGSTFSSMALLFASLLLIHLLPGTYSWDSYNASYLQFKLSLHATCRAPNSLLA